MGRFIGLEEIKQHLYIDFEDDNEYLEVLISVAEDTIENYLNIELTETEENPLPNAIKHSIKLLVGSLYNSREASSYGVTITRVPFYMEYLLQPYKNYKR